MHFEIHGNLTKKLESQKHFLRNNQLIGNSNISSASNEKYVAGSVVDYGYLTL